jgi:hypothetical protein
MTYKTSKIEKRKSRLLLKRIWLSKVIILSRGSHKEQKRDLIATLVHLDLILEDKLLPKSQI